VQRAIDQFARLYRLIDEKYGDNYLPGMTIPWTPDLATHEGPRYLAIAECLADDIRAGRLGGGDRLPPHRELAERLGVTVGTVSRAYAEADRRGLVRGEVGRGTYVRARALERPGTRDGGAPIDLGLNLPLHAEDPDLGEALRELASRPGVNDLLGYQPTLGGARHRRAGAAWLAQHGLEVPAERVVVTAGAQHAISVVLGTLCRAGDVLLTEPLTYPGVLSVARLLGLRPRSVAVDEEGLRPDALDRAGRELGPGQVLYCLPTLHNPTTATMSAGRRRDIAAVARDHDLRIVEDDVHRLLAPDAGPPLAALAPERTCYIASTSKVVAGGLRVAFVAVPPGTAEGIAHTVSASLWIPPPLTAELAAGWIEDGTAAATAERKRREARARQDLAAELLSGSSLRGGGASFFAWLGLQDGWTAESFTAAARRRGVIVAPSTAFALPGVEAPPAVRLSLSAPYGRQEMTAGLSVLADILARGPAPAPAIV
jgi:DNA-binding transcriptional MocR family regulator